MTVTPHHIDEEWKMVSLVLKAAASPSITQEKKNIGHELIRLAESSQIVKLVSAVTHDEAANMVAALREAHEEATTTQDASDDKWESVVCSAHRLQTCLRHAMKVEDVAETVCCARKLVGHFRHSVKATLAPSERANHKEEAQA